MNVNLIYSAKNIGAKSYATGSYFCKNNVYLRKIFIVVEKS